MMAKRLALLFAGVGPVVCSHVPWSCTKSAGSAVAVDEAEGEQQHPPDDDDPYPNVRRCSHPVADPVGDGMEQGQRFGVRRTA